MNAFQISSIILDLQSTIIYDFMLENVTTNPFEFVTEQDSASESQEHSGLFIIIYGIGGALIFFTIASICYRIFMPPISDAAYARFEERNRQNLRELARLQRIERERFQNDPENAVNPSQMVENTPYHRTDASNHNRIDAMCETERTQESHGTPQGNERPFSGVIRHIGSAIRSHTAPKQICEHHQNTPMRNVNLNATIRNVNLDATIREGDIELGEFPTFEEYEENVPSLGYIADNGQSITPPNEFQQKKTPDHDLYQIERSTTPTLLDSVLLPVSPEGHCQSSPTSPDSVRRRISSNEIILRRSSSLQ